jgi:opacity protein-like surface antigen
MKIWNVSAGAALAAVLALPAAAAVLPMDAPTKMGEVTAVCGGVGSDKDNGQWNSYPIKLEFSNGSGQFVSGENVKLMNQTGATITEFDCTGPWVLLQLPKGNYSATATMSGSTNPPRSVKFSPPATGQKRVEIQFPAIPANQ